MAKEIKGGKIPFTGLSDAPSSYTSSSGKFVRVKSDESGLEFTTSSESMAHVDLTDMPDSGGTNSDHDLRYLTLPSAVALSFPALDTGKFLTNDGSVLSWATVSVSGYVPYTGATADVDLGVYNFTTTGTLGAGVGTLSGNNTTGSWTALNLTNTRTPASGNVLQTTDLVFNLTQSVNSVITRHEAAKISAYKVSDWFHATTEADTDSGLKFYTTDAGTSAVKMTLNNAGNLTVAGAIDTTGTMQGAGFKSTDVTYGIATNNLMARDGGDDVYTGFGTGWSFTTGVNSDTFRDYDGETSITWNGSTWDFSAGNITTIGTIEAAQFQTTSGALVITGTNITGLGGLNVYGAVTGYTFGYDDGMGTTSTFATYNLWNSTWDLSNMSSGTLEPAFTSWLSTPSLSAGLAMNGYSIDGMYVTTTGFYNRNIDINTNGYITGGGAGYVVHSYFDGTYWQIGYGGTGVQSVSCTDANIDHIGENSSTHNVVFDNHIDLSTFNLITDGTTGTQIGTANTQKLGFFGQTPAVQQTHIADIGTPYVMDDLKTAVNALIAMAETLGFTATA